MFVGRRFLWVTAAVGQAVQNMNIMFNLDETAGLRLKASAF
jgi:N-acetyl-gamma-glutamyl-phosphate reductase